MKRTAITLLFLITLTAIAGDGFDVLKKHEGIYGYDLAAKRKEMEDWEKKRNRETTERDLDKAVGRADRHSFLVKGKKFSSFSYTIFEDVYSIHPGKLQDGVWRFKLTHDDCTPEMPCLNCPAKRVLVLREGRVSYEKRGSESLLQLLQEDRLTKHKKLIHATINGPPKTAKPFDRLGWAEQARAERLKAKLEREPDLVTLIDEHSLPLQHRLVRLGRLEQLRTLCKHSDFDPTLKYERKTALQFLLGQRMLSEKDLKRVPQMVKVLIDAGIDLGRFGVYAWPPLEKAIVFGRADVLEGYFRCGLMQQLRTCYQNQILMSLKNVEQPEFEDLKKILELAKKCRPCPAQTGGPLIAAALAKEDPVRLVSALLDMGVPVDSEDGYGRTALDYAVQKRRIAVAEFLLEKGADPDYPAGLKTPRKNTYGKMRELFAKYPQKKLSKEQSQQVKSLLDASKKGDTAQVKDLLGAGLKPDAHDPEDREAALHVAKDAATAKLLIDAGANVNFRSRQLYTPLHLAAMYGRTDVVELLVHKGAWLDVGDGKQATAIFYAARRRKLDALKALVRAKADVNMPDFSGSRPLDQAMFYDPLVPVLLEAGAEVNYKAHGGRPLHLAKSAEIVKLLLQHKADPDIRDSELQTVLFYPRKPEVHKLLLAAGANPNARDKNQCTPIFFAANAAHAKLLLAAGAKLDALDKDGATPLHYAVLEPNLDVAELLLKKGFKIDMEDSKGRTPLFYCRTGSAVKFLLQRGAESKHRDKNGRTALFFNDKNHAKLPAVKELVQQGASVDIVDKQGNTPIHAGFYVVDTVKYYQSKGVDINARNKEGLTAFDLADKQGSRYYVNALRPLGAKSSKELAQKEKEGK